MRINDWSSDVCSADLRGRQRDAAEPDDDRKHMERAGEGEIIHDRRLLPKIDRRCTPFARANVALAQTRARRGDYAAAMARIRFEDDAIEVDARVKIGRVSCRERVGQYV